MQKMRLSYKGKLLSEIHPAFYFTRVWQKRCLRALCWAIGPKRYCSRKSLRPLGYRYVKHSSKLMRDYGSAQYRTWQINKIENLRVAIPEVTNVLIRPGEVFSFWKLVGRPSVKKGYVEGMEISRGRAQPGIGGGLCQLTNLINWMAWHTPLQIIERSHHSYDPFPDIGRVLPFGSGAAIFWNYVDLQIRNSTTDETFQIVIWLDGKHLKGEIRSNKKPRFSYKIFERNHYFIRKNSVWWRSNEIWRRKYGRGVGGKLPTLLGEEMLVRNFSRVLYEPDISRYEIRQTDSEPA